MDGAAAEREPSPERQAELDAAYQRNLARRKPPYAQVPIRTLGEVRWILQERGWSGEEGAAQDARPDFREANFANAWLVGAHLAGADLRDATLTRTNLRGAVLNAADLSIKQPSYAGYVLTPLRRAFASRIVRAASILAVGAFLLFWLLYLMSAVFGAMHLGSPISFVTAESLAVAARAVLLLFCVLLVLLSVYVLTFLWLDREAAPVAPASTSQHASAAAAQTSGPDLTDASLELSNLRYRYLASSSLRSARLIDANLSAVRAYAADFTGATVRGVDLSGADLTNAHLDSVTVLRDVIIDSTSRLNAITWNDVPLSKSPTAKTALDRIAYLHDASRVYRHVALALRTQGLSRQASAYRLRELRAERQAALLELRGPYWIGSAILDAVAGYGERPGRIFATYLIVVSGFAAGYLTVTNQMATVTTHLHWYEAVVLSVSSFHGRGFFPTTITLGDPVAILAAVEAIVGLFLELILIATFSRRLLGN
jgi:uncharacterized protein YjbI with pentapeptide repeats